MSLRPQPDPSSELKRAGLDKRGRGAANWRDPARSPKGSAGKPPISSCSCLKHPRNANGPGRWGLGTGLPEVGWAQPTWPNHRPKIPAGPQNPLPYFY